MQYRPEVSDVFTDEMRSYYYEQLHRAQARLDASGALKTPLQPLDCFPNVFLKCENLQRTGAFKFRGARNALGVLVEEGGASRGVVTYSAGNHGRALAAAGAELGVPVTAVVPQNAPQIKLRAIENLGAELVTYDPARTQREVLAQEISRERQIPLIPPYDHPQVIAGQGTAGLEIVHQLPDVERILVCTGGGGLLSGIALAAAKHRPSCRVIGVEPELADDATRSYHSRTLHTVSNPPTIADGARTSFLGAHTFPIVLNVVADMVTVSEEAIKEGMRLLFREAKLVAEPAGALAIAALIEGAVASSDGPTVVLVSGGNVDAAVFTDVLAS